MDGKKQDLLKANTMYMALELEPGDHSIVLTYHTPDILFGQAISIITTLPD